MQRSIVLDTLGKLRAHGYGMFAWCSACAAPYPCDVPPDRLLHRLAARATIEGRRWLHAKYFETPLCKDYNYLRCAPQKASVPYFRRGGSHAIRRYGL